MNDNRWNIKRIVIYLVATVFVAYGLGAVIFLSNPKTFNWDKNHYTIQDEKSSDTKDISRIAVNVSSTELNIISSENQQVTAHLYGDMSSSSYIKPELQCYKSGDTLYINVKTTNGIIFGFFNSSLKLDITIPAAFSQSLQVHSSSGSAVISDLKLKDLDLNLSSGSTSINRVSLDSFSYDCSSGSLRAEALTTKSSKLHTSSGSQTLSNFTGDLKASSSSGGIRVQYAAFSNNIDINASSGGVNITLPQDSNFYLDASASSGSIKTNFPITVAGNGSKHSLKGTVGNGKNNISIHTSSGGISIEK